MLGISHAFTLDEAIRYNFVPAIRHSFVTAWKEEQLCTCTTPKLYRYSANAREKERVCFGSRIIRYRVNAALFSQMIDKFIARQLSRFFISILLAILKSIFVFLRV